MILGHLIVQLIVIYCWLVVWNIFFCFYIYWEFHHPIWPSYLSGCLNHHPDIFYEVSSRPGARGTLGPPGSAGPGTMDFSDFFCFNPTERLIYGSFRRKRDLFDVEPLKHSECGLCQSEADFRGHWRSTNEGLQLFAMFFRPKMLWV